MANQAIANALRRRSEIQKELEEIDLFLRLHEKFSVGMNPELMDSERGFAEKPANLVSNLFDDEPESRNDN
jgi:hypothetical protein